MGRVHSFAVALPLAIALSTGAEARSPVNEWFCKVLKAPFNPKAAIAAFPLEKLPPAIETREERTDDGGKKRTRVEWEAEGEKFKVSHDYAFANDDVTDPYGFSLTVSVADFALADSIKPEMDKWLAEFGTPERSPIGGRAVYGGPKSEWRNEPFDFQRWGASAVYQANWFNRDDIKYAAEVCNRR